MLHFEPLTPAHRAQYLEYTKGQNLRLCVDGFSTHYLWGIQKITFIHGCVVFFSKYGEKFFYSYPLGNGDRRAAAVEILQDSKERGIPVRIGGMIPEAAAELEAFFPQKFRFSCNRNESEYVYAVSDLAELKGRKFQKKRNHANKFRSAYPDYRFLPLTKERFPLARSVFTGWYASQTEDINSVHWEETAVNRAMNGFEALGMEGALLLVGDTPIAVTMASPLSERCFDVHFEKALPGYDGAYAVINQEFSAMLREKHPSLEFLNREEDMGSPGLRQAKLTYNPHHLEERIYAQCDSEA